jgi:hypothetical protein
MKQSKRVAKLESRQKAFDNMGTNKAGRGYGGGIDTSKGFHRPGSVKK